MFNSRAAFTGADRERQRRARESLKNDGKDGAKENDGRRTGG